MSEREIFLAVLDLDDASARAAYLEEACGGNAALRSQVEALLRAYEAAGGFLAKPAIDATELHAALLYADTKSRCRTVSRDKTDDDDLTFLSAPRQQGSLGRIGHYEVLEVLGRGAFGIVFRAFDELLQRVVAVKVLAPELAATSPARKRFLREAQSSAKVRHENVVQVFGVEEQPLPYLVMEFVPGESLQQRLDRVGPLEATEAAKIAVQIAEGLAAAHDTGLIHRDIKPGNILIDAGPQLRIKITDFGLARAADDASLTQSGLLAGTPMFMSPEQAKGERIDHRADLFSLGSVLYTMCSGRPPFRANNTLAVLKRVAEATPRPIPDLIPEVPCWLCDIIERLHAKNPADRISSAREVARELERCLVDRPKRSALRSVARAQPTPAWKPIRRAVGAMLVLGLLALGITESAGVTSIRSTVVRWLAPSSTRVVAVDDPGRRLGARVRLETSRAGANVEAANWERSVAALAADEQVRAVVMRLKKLNPDWEEKVTPTIEDGIVRRVELSAVDVKNLSPVRAFAGLTSLACKGSSPQKASLADLSPLSGMKLTALYCDFTHVSDLSVLRGMPLVAFACTATDVSDLSPLAGAPLRHLYCDNTAVSDLTPLRGMPLVALNVSYTQVSSLRPLVGMPLTSLWANHSRIADLAPLAGMSLQWITIQNTAVSDLAPLKGMPLTRIYLDFVPARDAEILRSLTTLQSINDMPAPEFWSPLELE